MQDIVETLGPRMKPQMAIVPRDQPGIAKCPTCGSTRLGRITSGEIWSELLPARAIGSAGKTVQCANCGYRW
jgi:predicted RNA-binding Zn-ribbon protein involved in translation (DUF1610 family)